LQAVCVPELDPVAKLADSLHGAVHFVESSQSQTHCAPQSLLNKVRTDNVDVSAWLGPVWVANTTHEALNMRADLKAG